MLFFMMGKKVIKTTLHVLLDVAPLKLGSSFIALGGLPALHVLLDVAPLKLVGGIVLSLVFSSLHVLLDVAPLKHNLCSSDFHR